ncbi:hypothetical protein [Limnoglobus roseus]|uniref:Outer membrane protein assembly factor BamE n=1 Tax=Limnoglobus roseus TaxID=2598579 RepID=A0A5C1AIN3_9BACT|nr:hypothetical protein [Limnoglobus roseus]QEL17552.1 hypothetical protein PX52LOC_04543 [Limnoglobus roseus]
MMWQRWKWPLAGIGVAAVVIAVWVIRSPGRPFNAVDWQDERLASKGVRLEMAERLVARGTLKGIPQAEIIGRMGKPAPASYSPNWQMVYWLAQGRGSSPTESDWLMIRLTDDGFVSEYRIVRD